MLRQIVRVLLWPDHVPEWARALGFDQPGALLAFRVATLGVYFLLAGVLCIAVSGFLGPVDLFGWRPLWDAAALVGVGLFIAGVLIFIALIGTIGFLRILGKL